MRHRPRHDWNRLPLAERDSSGRAPGSGMRFGILAVGLSIFLGGIVLRIADLQLRQQSLYIEPFEQVQYEEDVLMARDGRILAADGSILADSVTEYDLLVHYRWLEDPVDSRWLRRKAWEQLSRNERRQSAHVAFAEQQVRERHQQLWADLSADSGHTIDDFTTVAREIQVRVQKIWETVEARRVSQLTTHPEATPQPGEASRRWLWWQAMVDEVTRPPQRNTLEPLVIAEQEDYHLIWKNIPEKLVTRIAAHPERYPGTRVRHRSTRVYPQNETAAHLLGARVTTKRAADGQQNPPAEEGDSYGRTGLERQYNSLLTGIPGRLQRTVSRHGEIISSRVLQEARHGRDLVLTLDLTLQQRAEDLLERSLTGTSQAGDDATPNSIVGETLPTGGSLVAIDIHTGAVLAAASAPRFDANLLVSADSSRWAELLADPRKPFFSRVTQMAVPPGSVFKVVTAAGLLQSGTFNADSTIDCRGYLQNPEQHRCLIYRHHGLGHGSTNLADALCQSCNVYFFAGARRQDPAVLEQWARSFGLGAPTGIDLPQETAGHLPGPAAAAVAQKRWGTGDTLGLAIGQSSLTTTPLQMARVMAAIANGGSLVTPHLATSGGPVSLQSNEVVSVRPVFAHPNPEPIPGLQPATLAAIQEGLYRVVHDPSGTGYKTVRLKDVTIAGKTGTAEVGRGRPDHAWFAGYAPADQPRVAFAVVVEHGGSGSKAAGPIAKEFVRCLLEQGLITPQTPLAERSP